VRRLRSESKPAGAKRNWVETNPGRGCRVGPPSLSRQEDWSRKRYSAGVEWLVGHTAVLDTYYCRQDDSHSSPEHVNAFGLALNLFF